MKRKKEIFRNRDSFGGYGYRVMANHQTVTIQERYQGSRWKDVAVADREVFDQWADQVELYNPYKGNSHFLCRLAEEIRKGSLNK